MPYEGRQHREPSRRFQRKWKAAYVARCGGRIPDDHEITTAWWSWAVPIYRAGASSSVAAIYAHRCETLYRKEK